MKTKRFDCMQMKHFGAAPVQEHAATLTKEQEVAFWRERSQHLRRHQEGLAGRSEPPAPA